MRSGDEHGVKLMPSESKAILMKRQDVYNRGRACLLHLVTTVVWCGYHRDAHVLRSHYILYIHMVLSQVKVERLEDILRSSKSTSIHRPLYIVYYRDDVTDSMTS